MRDLEIRGAGNILGTEQSGHIASVGYELYCQLLENAVRRLKRQPLREHRHVAVDLPISAYLPSSYVPPGRHKIEVYRKLSSVGTAGELSQLEEELRDRFGPVPEEAARLLGLKSLQLAAQFWQIDDIHLEGKYVVFGYRNSHKIRGLLQKSGADLRIVDGRHAYLLLRGTEADGGLLEQLKSVLQPA
jgi:transcription-repair coupling factor (superfamily II helicase)